MIRATLSPDNPVAQWVPPMVPLHYTATTNLLGYRNISKPRAEAISMLDAAEITFDIFPNFPSNTGFNYALLESVSAVIVNTKTYID